MGHFLGNHFLVELAGCKYSDLNDHKLVEQQMLLAARFAKATIVTSSFHKFNPYGVSGVVVISESHISIHTWPELGYAMIDVVTCGNEAIPSLAVEYFLEWLNPSEHNTMQLLRGCIDDQHGVVHPTIEVVSNSAGSG